MPPPEMRDYVKCNFVELKVTRGKRVVRGRRLPIVIEIPHKGVTNIDVRQALTTYLEVSKAASKQWPFPLPDFVPKRASVGKS